MTTKTFIQLVTIPDFRYDANCTTIDYDGIADDCDAKTISLLEAIDHISMSVFSIAEKEEINRDKIMSLTCVISELSQLAIATNKISMTASYLSGVKGGNHGA